jgi:hypothetical protein
VDKLPGIHDDYTIHFYSGRNDNSVKMACDSHIPSEVGVITQRDVDRAHDFLILQHLTGNPGMVV